MKRDANAKSTPKKQEKDKEKDKNNTDNYSKLDKDNEKDNEDSDDEMDSDAVSNVFDTSLTLQHSSDDIIFNNSGDFTEIVEDTTNNDDAMSNVFDTPLTPQHSSNTDDDVKYNRIIPSLKTRYAQDTLLKDSSLQKATRAVIKSHPQVPKFTTKLDEHDTQG